MKKAAKKKKTETKVELKNLLVLEKNRGDDLYRRLCAVASQNDSLRAALAGAEFANKKLQESNLSLDGQVKQLDTLLEQASDARVQYGILQDQRVRDTENFANRLQQEISSLRFRLAIAEESVLNRDTFAQYQEREIQGLLRELQHLRRPWYWRTIDRLFRRK